MTERPYITCRQLIDFIADYIDGTLEPEARLDFERHLVRCASCRDYLRSYRATLSLERLFVMGNDEPVEDAPEELVASILKRAR
jgi:anti-sigma factor RsiW